MNRQPDVEPVLRAYLADTGDRAPDRVLTDVADRIARQPRRAWRLRGRPFMNTYAKVALAAAAVLVVAVASYNLLPKSGVGPPATSPSASPKPTPPALPDGSVQAGDYVIRATPSDRMRFVIAAPAGWIGFGGFFLGGPTNRSDAPNGIGISVNHDPRVVTNPCDSSVETPAPSIRPASVDDLVAAISAREDLQVSGITDASLAGYSGKRLDVLFPTVLACSQHYLFGEPKGLYANGPANRWRIWILDVNGDTAEVVLLDYAATPAADRNAAQAAIDSIRIEP